MREEEDLPRTRQITAPVRAFLEKDLHGVGQINVVPFKNASGRTNQHEQKKNKFVVKEEDSLSITNFVLDNY